MADQFDDTRLDDPDALYAADGLLRHLAGSGARLRIEAEAAEGPLAAVQVERPRAVLAVGPEARLLRAVLEPWCPIPFVAWPSTTLPQWVGTWIWWWFWATANRPGMKPCTRPCTRPDAVAHGS